MDHYTDFAGADVRVEISRGVCRGAAAITREQGEGEDTPTYRLWFDAADAHAHCQAAPAAQVVWVR